MVLQLTSDHTLVHKVKRKAPQLALLSYYYCYGAEVQFVTYGYVAAVDLFSTFHRQNCKSSFRLEFKTI